MKYLMDTHIFLWYVEQNSNLNNNILAELDSYSNQIYLSIESLREIAIKTREGKLKLKLPFEDIIRDLKAYQQISILNIIPTHLLTLYHLEIDPDHRDPFDQMIINQAVAEKFTLISADRKFPFYRTQGLKLFEND